MKCCTNLDEICWFTLIVQSSGSAVCPPPYTMGVQAAFIRAFGAGLYRAISFLDADSDQSTTQSSSNECHPLSEHTIAVIEYGSSLPGSVRSTVKLNWHRNTILLLSQIIHAAKLPFPTSIQYLKIFGPRF